MNVKFQNSLCTCAPTKIQGSGNYAWTKGSFEKLQNIPKLPDELLKMTSAKKTPTSTPRATPTATATDAPVDTTPATDDETHDLKALCACMTLDQIDNYDIWYKLGLVLKGAGAPQPLGRGQQAKRQI